MATDPWYPYSCSKSKEYPGIFVELPEEALKSSGHKLEVIYYPWSRAIAELRKGNITTFGSGSMQNAPGMIY